MKRYLIQCRYQDEGWEDSDISFDSMEEAIDKAWEFAAEPIIYGIVRVIDTVSHIIEVTYSAGENPHPIRR